MERLAKLRDWAKSKAPGSGMEAVPTSVLGIGPVERVEREPPRDAMTGVQAQLNRMSGEIRQLAAMIAVGPRQNYGGCVVSPRRRR